MAMRTHKSTIIRLLFGFGVLLLFLSIGGVHQARAAVITVNSNADTETVGDGQCTLREAINNANLSVGGDITGGDCVASTAGLDTIAFDVNDAIDLTTMLPIIYQPVVIDGTTDPDYSVGGGPEVWLN